MKKIHLILLISIFNFSVSNGQCLCGKLEIQICFDDLIFSNGNSNYELSFLEKPKFIHHTTGILKENAFSKDTLKIILPTENGIQKLVIQLKNTLTKSSMNLTIKSMYYDNDYFIDIGNYVEGHYIFDWQKINRCQSQNKTTKIVDCEGMEFKQLLLLSEKTLIGDFNHNKIKVLKLNSFLQNNPFYNKNLKDKTFKLWSEPFTINGMNCVWEYKVKYTNETDEKSTNIFVNLLEQKLINFKTKELLLNLDLDDFFFIFSPVDISILDNNNFEHSTTGNFITYPAPYSYNNDNLDINKDGFYDFQFLTEIAGAGTNTYYKVYLFNPKNNQFDYSEVFSDYNIEYDSNKNRTSSFMKSGAGNYYYQFKNLKKNKKDVEFVENVHHYSDTIFYEKLINDKVVLEKKIILGEDGNWEKYLERK